MKFPVRQAAVKNLIKLEAGHSIVGVFRGEPRVVYKHWVANKPVECTGRGCKECEAENKANYRIQINLVTKENGALAAKVFEGGARFQKMLELMNEETPLETHFVKITRTGKGTDTTYMVQWVKDGALTKSQEASIAKVELNVLGGAAEAGASAAKGATDLPDDEEGDASFDTANM